MSGGKHTPGPWHRDYAGMGNVWSKDCKVADVANPRQDALYREVGDEERGANARLISAAPDLLTALQDAIGALEQDLDAGRDSGDADWEGLAYQRLEAARVSIAKATEVQS